MPRGTRTITSRRPTWDDLNERQQAIMNALPEELKELFLEQLPAIALSPAASQKKAEAIKRHLKTVEGLHRAIARNKLELENAVRDLESGRGSADQVDLRKLLAPPAIEGVSVRYQRGPG